MASMLPTTQQAKLRKSCDICATTKVGCSKEKPTCSRCAKRGLICSYSAAKRAGRIARAAEQIINSNLNPPSPLFEIVDPFCNDLDASHNGPGKAFGADTEAVNISQPLTHDLSDLDEFLDAMSGHTFDIPLSELDSADFCLESSSTGIPSDSNRSSRSSSVLFSSSSDMDFNSWTELDQDHNVVCDDSMDITLGKSDNDTSEVQMPCHCFHRAAGLSSGLSGRLSSTQNNAMHNLDKFQSALDHTQNDLDTIRSILTCTCSDDGDLMIALLLALLKAIAWYTTAARLLTSEASHDGHGRLSTFQHDTADQQRLSAQAILSKLMDVQMLVQDLSQRVGWDVTEIRTKTAFQTDTVSAGLACSLHSDLCKRLYALSQAIIARLRQI